MPHLILVKHALPEIIPALPPINGTYQKSVVANVHCLPTS